MSKYDFAAWMIEMGFKHVSQAADALEADRRRITKFMRGEVQVDLCTELACMYLLERERSEGIQKSSENPRTENFESVSKAVVIDSAKADQILKMLSVIHEQNIQTELERKKPDQKNFDALNDRLLLAELENKKLSESRDNIQRQLQDSEGDLASAQDANRLMRGQFLSLRGITHESEMGLFFDYSAELKKINFELKKNIKSENEPEILLKYLNRFIQISNEFEHLFEKLKKLEENKKNKKFQYVFD